MISNALVFVVEANIDRLCTSHFEKCRAAFAVDQPQVFLNELMSYPNSLSRYVTLLYRCLKIDWKYERGRKIVKQFDVREFPAFSRRHGT
jgi:hypothetical protein